MDQVISGVGKGMHRQDGCFIKKYTKKCIYICYICTFLTTVLVLMRLCNVRLVGSCTTRVRI
jgi:hypothetical protein